jgi:hypothetical protein
MPARLKQRVPDLELAMNLCHWVRTQQPSGKSWIPVENTFLGRLKGDSDDPLTLIEEQHRGRPATCRRFSYVLVGAAASVGMKARVVIVAESFFKGHDPSHVMSELWIPELHNWVLMDAMWDNLYVLDGRPASAVDIYNAVHSNRAGRVSLMHAGVPAQIQKRQDLEREFKNLYIPRTNALFDGYQVCFLCAKEISFVHLATPHSSEYPVRFKRALTSIGIVSLAASSAVATYLSVLLLQQRRMTSRISSRSFAAGV